MHRTLSIFSGSVLGITLLAWTCVAQQPNNDPGTTTSDKVGSAVNSIKKGAREAGDAIRDQYYKARTSIHDFGVQSRVYGRIHWDKALNGSKVEIDVRQDGVATLTGVVPGALAKAKAVELTRDTVGVTRVIDQLTIAPAGTTIPADDTRAPATTKP